MLTGARLAVFALVGAVLAGCGASEPWFDGADPADAGGTLGSDPPCSLPVTMDLPENWDRA